MAVSRRDYNAEQVSAAHAVMLELGHLLGEFRDGIVVIGGWVPTLLLPDSREPHIGSTDVDLALDHRALSNPGYSTIRKLLISRGYREGSQPFIFSRKVTIEGSTLDVEVHLASGEYEGTTKTHRTQPVQDLRARKARGCDLAFDLYSDVQIEGALPDGGKDSVTVRVAGIVPFLVMKGMALHDRMKEKDAWDIYYCVRNYPRGIEGLIEEVLPHRTHGLVNEGLSKISDQFRSTEHLGPRFVADFAEITDPEDRALILRDAYERIRAFLEGVGIV